MRGLLNYDLAYFKSMNRYSFPEIFPYEEKVKCDKWINFDNSIQDKTGAKGLHFYEHDYKFERVWNNPKKYLSVFERFEFIIMTDFSLYYDFPVALQIYNKFRNHWLCAYFSTLGINMIPNIRLSNSDNYDWSFMGYPKNSVVAFSDTGAIRDKLSRVVMIETYDEMIKRLSPIQVLYFTRSKTNAPSECDIILIPFLKGGE